ncbi:MAG: hypothetical protein GF418_04610, partial [Chitinivibrionales bacterium]|nr:hypothetical protein [Chitinivibrionales bacterium]
MHYSTTPPLHPSGCVVALALFLAASPLRAFYDEFSSSGYAYGGAAYLDRAGHAQSAGLSRAVTAWRG